MQGVRHTMDHWVADVTSVFYSTFPDMLEHLYLESVSQVHQIYHSTSLYTLLPPFKYISYLRKSHRVSLWKTKTNFFPPMPRGHLGNFHGHRVSHSIGFVSKYGKKWLAKGYKNNCDPVTDIYHIANGNVSPSPSILRVNNTVCKNWISGIESWYIIAPFVYIFIIHLTTAEYDTAL